MSKYKSFISVQSVDKKKIFARRTRSPRRLLDAMSLTNPKNCNKRRGICILNPKGIPSHSPGLRLQPRVPDKKNIQPQRGCGNCVIEDAATHSGLMGMGDARYPGWPFGQPWALIRYPFRVTSTSSLPRMHRNRHCLGPTQQGRARIEFS
jgi:hypothetical protein